MRAVAGRRTTVKTRHAYLLVVFVVGVAAVFVVMTQGFSKTLTPPVDEYIEVVVQDGDTLWHIAQRHGSPGGDPRKMVDLIREVNDLSSAVVRPGQVLKVPAP